MQRKSKELLKKLTMNLLILSLIILTPVSARLVSIDSDHYSITTQNVREIETQLEIAEYQASENARLKQEVNNSKFDFTSFMYGILAGIITDKLFLR